METTPSAKDAFNQLATQAIEEQLAFFPLMGTDLGFHQYDQELGSFAQEDLDAFSRRLALRQTQLQSIDRSQLDAESRADYDTLADALQATHFDITTLQQFQTDPNFYVGWMVQSVLLLARRHFAPPQERAQAAIARLKQAPRLFSQAVANLQRPPRIAVQIALDQLPATAAFLEKEWLEAFGLEQGALQHELAEAAGQAAAALRDFGRRLEQRLPQADPVFAIGAERFRQMLRWHEHVETPLDQLIEEGFAELHRKQALFRETARQIDPQADPIETLRRLQQDHPGASEVLSYAQQLLSGLRQFIIDHDLVSLPTLEMPQVVETPPFMRATTLASIDPPGAFERVATQAYYQVTLPDPTWPAQQIDEQLRALNRPVMHIISAHEVYPGHYVQFLHLPNTPSKVRKVFSSTAFVEGWAHYTEELMVEAGFGEGDPRMRLVQTMEALERIGRYLVSIQMHTQGMPFEEAVTFFKEECYMEEQAARREALRGTGDPMYLAYTLGKLSFLQLREEVKQRLGTRFSLRIFHDACLDEGFPALPILRERLLGEGGRFSSISS
ncbi:MAG: DUF885 domain-containing protein [Firmicutes bacterium]|nr:DUF885 domain-containing protein [Bacillota bacterium]